MRRDGAVSRLIANLQCQPKNRPKSLSTALIHLKNCQVMMMSELPASETLASFSSRIFEWADWLGRADASPHEK